MKKIIVEFLQQPISKEQSKDTGMAMVLLLLIFSSMFKRQSLVAAAMAVLVINMIFPQVYRPVAVVWYGFSHLLGTVVSRILLTIVFVTVVTPIGIARRVLGKDTLKLRGFKGSEESVMLVRNHTFIGQDIEKPY